MVDEKLINSIVKDLELCTKTSVALAQKLDNLNKSLNELFKSLNINAHIEGTAAPKTSQSHPGGSPAPAPAPAPSSTPAPAPAPVSSGGSSSKGTSQRNWDGSFQKEGIASVLNKIGKLISDGAAPEQIADEMERARDSLMSIAKASSPVFSEIGRKAREIRNLKELTSEKKSELMEVLVDWRSRLIG